jgi:hypothetical protein
MKANHVACKKRRLSGLERKDISSAVAALRALSRLGPTLSVCHTEPAGEPMRLVFAGGLVGPVVAEEHRYYFLTGLLWRPAVEERFRSILNIKLNLLRSGVATQKRGDEQRPVQPGGDAGSADISAVHDYAGVDWRGTVELQEIVGDPVRSR